MPLTKYLVLLALSAVFFVNNAFARCAASPHYEVSLEVLSCKGVTHNEGTAFETFGSVLEVQVLTMKRLENLATTDWTPVEEPLPKNLTIFHGYSRTLLCKTIRASKQVSARLAALCCDGGEPRCGYGASVYVYDVES